MIDTIRTGDVGQTLGQRHLPPLDPAVVRGPAESDAAIQVDLADIVNQARQAPETEPNAVARARELLLSGQLTSPKLVRMAAESIISMGI